MSDPASEADPVHLFFLFFLSSSEEPELFIESSWPVRVYSHCIPVGFVNSLAKKHYEMGGDSNVQEVIYLSEEKNINWDEISEKVPDLPRSWFELSRIPTEERIEFVADSWLSRLSFNPMATPYISRFFSRLDDIAILIVKRDFEYSVEMIYSFSDNSSFFRGFPPLGEEDVRLMKREVGVNLPRDFLVFIRLHNGFGKLTEPGIIRAEDLMTAREGVRRILTNADKVIQWQGQVIDPESLIPFYEDYGLNSFQCFFSDWYPNSEMGNVYLSGINYTISDTANRIFWSEQMAFSSFLEWLAMYLEGMNVSD